MAKAPRTLINVFSNDWLQHSALLTNSYSHGFISESGVVFNFVQRNSKCLELLNQAEMLKASHKYHSVIHSWYMKTMNLLNDTTLSEEEKCTISDQSKILRKMEIAWHLCEILYINIPSAGTLLVQLLSWVRWHFTYYLEMAEQLIVSDLPQMHPHYWDIITFFVLRGDMEHASLFLELHSESKTDPEFIIVKDLLKKFPQINNTIVVHEFYLRWGYWHDCVMQALSEHRSPNLNKRSHIQLNLILSLLAGERDAFHKVNHLFHSWYQLMVSYALFTDPCLKGDMDVIIEKSIDIFYFNNPNGSRSLSMFDKLIRSSFNYDLIEVIKQSSMCFGDAWWFVTHFVDLIYNSSRYNDYQIANIALIRNSFVVNYANSLLFDTRKQFWQLSIEYFINCKDSHHHIWACLEQVPFENERELQRLLNACRRFQFTDLEMSFCRIQSRKYLSIARRKGEENQYGSALFWAIRSKDKMLINYIVDQFLLHYLYQQQQQTSDNNDKNLLLDEDMISNIGGSIVLSERLIFLCKYHEFHQLIRENERIQAGKILVDMLTSNAIPEFFQFQVIKDCLPLIESSENIFLNTEQTCKVISSLEQLLYRLRRNLSNNYDNLEKNQQSNGYDNNNNNNNNCNGTLQNNSTLWNDYFLSSKIAALENNRQKNLLKTKSEQTLPDNSLNNDATTILTLSTKSSPAEQSQTLVSSMENNNNNFKMNEKLLDLFEKKLRIAAANNLSNNFVMFNNNDLSSTSLNDL